jgi:hypothetical protein
VCSSSSPSQSTLCEFCSIEMFWLVWIIPRFVWFFWWWISQLTRYRHQVRKQAAPSTYKQKSESYVELKAAGKSRVMEDIAGPCRVTSLPHRLILALIWTRNCYSSLHGATSSPSRRDPEHRGTHCPAGRRKIDWSQKTFVVIIDGREKRHMKAVWMLIR